MALMGKRLQKDHLLLFCRHAQEELSLRLHAKLRTELVISKNLISQECTREIEWMTMIFVFKIFSNNLLDERIGCKRNILPIEHRLMKHEDIVLGISIGRFLNLCQSIACPLVSALNTGHNIPCHTLLGIYICCDRIVSFTDFYFCFQLLQCRSILCRSVIFF